MVISITKTNAQSVFVKDNNGKQEIFLINKRGDTTSRDSMRNVKFTQKDVDAYLKIRPEFGDTSGRYNDIISIVRAAYFNEKYRCDDYTSALALAEEEFRIRTKVNHVLVIKSRRKMYLMKDRDTVMTFPIALGKNPVGQKEFEGDGKTPEGIYILDWQKSFEATFYSFHISYPNKEDIERAKKKGLKAGKDIMIHGTTARPKTRKDWTNGCIAIKNTDMAVFMRYVSLGDKIEIRK